MATSKTLAPTNVTISIPAMTDQPNASVLANCADKEADAINALNSQIDSKIGVIDSVTIAGGGNTSFTLPSDGVYLMAGYGSVGALANCVFLIGGYATASRCSVVNLTGNQTVTIDSSNTSALTFIATNGNSSNSITFRIIKLR